MKKAPKTNPTFKGKRPFYWGRRRHYICGRRPKHKERLGIWSDKDWTNRAERPRIEAVNLEKGSTFRLSSFGEVALTRAQQQRDQSHNFCAVT